MVMNLADLCSLHTTLPQILGPGSCVCLRTMFQALVLSLAFENRAFANTISLLSGVYYDENIIQHFSAVA